jgi:RNA polymerase sigma factor (sigma-70 family)
MNTIDTTSKQLIERWKQGDQQAASALWDRYMERLLGLVNERLANRYRSRFGASDVCQSALRSMLRRVQGDEYSFEHDGGVWSLLAQIALNKLNSRIRFEQAKRRSVTRERSMAADNEDSATDFVDAISREPSGEDVTEFRDLLREVLGRLSPEQRRYLVLQLRGGYSQKEIAKRLNLCDRTIRRMPGRIYDKVGDLLNPEGQLLVVDGGAEPLA